MNRSRLLLPVLLLLLSAGACARRGWCPDEQPDGRDTPLSEESIKDRDLGEGSGGEELGTLSDGGPVHDVASDPPPTDEPVPAP